MSLLTDFQRNKLLRDLQKPLSAVERKRIQIMLMADQGKTQQQVCKELNCSSATASRWMQMAQFGQAHNWQEKRPGRPPVVTQEYCDRLQELVQMNPQDLGLKITQWKAISLRQQLFRETGIKVSIRHINRLLKKMKVSIVPPETVSEIETARDRSPQNVAIGILIHDLKRVNQ
jgi:transposase